ACNALLNTLEAVSVVGNLDLNAASAFLRIRNGLTVDGVVSVNNNAVLEFVGNQTWNSGAFVFAGNSGALQFNGQLTLGPALTVHGKSGTIRDVAAANKLINQGTISADVAAGQLFII